MTIRHAATTGWLLAVAALAARAQDPKPAPLPKNVVPSAYRAQLVVDDRFREPVKYLDGSTGPDPRNRTGKMHCLVCEYGLSPVVAVFVRADPKDGKVAPGLAKLAKATDALIPKYRSDKLSAFVSFLTLEGGPKLVKQADGTETEAPKEYPDDENRDARAKDVKDFYTSAMTPNVPFSLGPTTSPVVTGFGIGDEPVTVVVYNRLRIVNRWALKAEDLTDAKIAEILSATEAMITGPKK